jgi:hypothetical protein
VIENKIMRVESTRVRVIKNNKTMRVESTRVRVVKKNNNNKNKIKKKLSFGAGACRSKVYVY